MGADGSFTNTYSPGTTINASPGQYVWIFALNSSNQVIGYTCHLLLSSEIKR